MGPDTNRLILKYGIQCICPDSVLGPYLKVGTHRSVPSRIDQSKIVKHVEPAEPLFTAFFPIGMKIYQRATRQTF
jgi:hypothetical protein